MRKLIIIAIAVLLAIMGNPAVHATSTTTPTYTDVNQVEIEKNYESSNTTNTKSPAETFNFTISNTSVTDAASGITVQNMPTAKIGTVTYAAGDAGSSNKSKKITVSLPDYNSVGIYTYTVKETAGDTVGVTYYGKDITLVVTVTQDETSGNLIRTAAVHTETMNATPAQTKSDEFPNTYSAGSLTVSKKVTGNMGDRNKVFSMKVKFTAPVDNTDPNNPKTLFVKEDITYRKDGSIAVGAYGGWSGTKEVTIQLKHGESVTFDNIPYGVTYEVVEDDYTSEKYDAAVYTYSDTNSKTDKVVDTASESAEVTNNKGVTVDTGIKLDNLPYILMLLFVVLGLVVVVAKNRLEREY
ncbi:MAG: hypothetical protein HUJ56_10620 [Erysipelotrichaceae bacterium]|nr:hypothetical protein [Erysipelotrichaceae bacterium]